MLHLRYLKGVIGAAAIQLLVAGSASAYQVSCGDNAFVVPYIASVMGEGRPAETGPATRFHSGVDIPACRYGVSVEAIEGGVVEEVPECVPGGACLRVRNTATGHAFDYIHMTRGVAVGTIVAAGDTIGTIPGNHLHLNEIATTGGVKYKVNPQRSGGLEFIDNDFPQFVNTSLGGTTGKVIPIKEFILGEDGNNSSPEVLPLLPDGSYLASGKIDVLVTARDGSSRKGVYSVGVTVAPKDNPGYFVYNQFDNIRFDSLIDSDWSGGIKTLILRRNSDSDTYFGTNFKQNFSPTIQASEQNSLDVSDSAFFPDGKYEVCAHIFDYPNAPIFNYQDTCVDFIRNFLISSVV